LEAKLKGYISIPSKVNDGHQMYIDDKCLFLGSNLNDIRDCRYDYVNSNVLCELYKKKTHFLLTIPVVIKEGDLTDIEQRMVIGMDLVTGKPQETENKGFFQMKNEYTNLLAWVGCKKLKDGSSLFLDGYYSVSRFILKFSDFTTMVLQFDHIIVKKY